MDVSHKTDKALCKIRVVSDCPQACSVSVNDNRLAVFDAFYNLITSLVSVNSKRNRAFIISVAWSDYCYRKLFFAVKLHEVVFAGNLVAGILPVRICKRSFFADDIVAARLLVGRRRTYIHKLTDLAFEQAVVAFKLFRHKTNKVAGNVKVHAFEFGGCSSLVVYVYCNKMCAFKTRVIIAVAPVYKIKLPALFQKQFRNCHAYSAGSAYE